MCRPSFGRVFILNVCYPARPPGKAEVLEMHDCKDAGDRTTQETKSRSNFQVKADIMGHEKPTMTYGLYSVGSGYEQMKDTVDCSYQNSVTFRTLSFFVDRSS